MEAERCQSLASNGKPCAAKVVDGTRCAWHSSAEEWVEKRRQWSSRGGSSRSNAARARKEIAGAALTREEWRGTLGLTARAVLRGSKPPAIGSAIAALARADIGIWEASELERRLAALEAALEQTERERERFG